MTAPATTATTEYVHKQLDSGVEFAADCLPGRKTVALSVRLLTGLSDEPEELTGIAGLVGQVLAKGTQRYDGRGLADAFDAIGAQWGIASGRQTTMLRAICLPEFVERVVELIGEMFREPVFPEDACRVAVELAQQDLKHLEDDPQGLLRRQIQRMTLGPVFGRHPDGTTESLARVTPALIREHWCRTYHAGRVQIAAAGPVDADSLAAAVDQAFGELGSSEIAGREDADFDFTPAQEHQSKDLKQEYLAITLPGLARQDPDFAVERVLIGVLSGGMSGRLFTEVREKQGLVYWVGAWHEQPRGRGVIHLGASTTPERCQKTYDTLLRELARLGEDMTETEVRRARDVIVAHMETETDLTRARAGALSDDLFHFGKPIGLEDKLALLRAVRLEDVTRVARALPTETRCVATLGPRAL